MKPKIILTRETLVALKPCDLPDRLRKFGGAEARRDALRERRK